MKAQCNHFPFFEVCSIYWLISTRNRFPLWIAISNISVFGYRFYGIRGDSKQKRKETFAFSKENGYMWTGRCSEKNNRVLFPVTVQSIKIKCVNN